MGHDTTDETAGQTINTVITDDGEAKGNDDGHGELITLDDSYDEGVANVTVGEQLTDSQREEIYSFLAYFKDVLRTEPGRTDLAEQVIRLKDNEPVYQTSYEPPDSVTDQFEKRTRQCEQLATIVYDRGKDRT